MRTWRRLRDALRAALVVWRAYPFIRVEDMERLDNRKQWVRHEGHINCRCAMRAEEAT